MILHLFAIFGLTFLLADSEGPFGLISKTRNLLLRNSFLGNFFYELLGCYFCLGCHMGWIVYLLSMDHFYLKELILYVFAGGSFSLLGGKLLSIK